MNKAYKVIYNRTRHMYQVVSELAKSHGRMPSTGTVSGRAGTILARTVLASLLFFGGSIGVHGATVNDGDTLSGGANITVTKDTATNTITVETNGLATTTDLTAVSNTVNTNTSKINTNTNNINTNSNNISTNSSNINANTNKINTLTALTNSLGLDSTKAGVKYFRANSTGADAAATGTDSVAVGPKAKATQTNAVAVGNDANATGDNAVAVGVNSKAAAGSSVAVGDDARNSSSATNGIAIGRKAVNGAFSGMTPDGDGITVMVGGGKNSISVGNNANARGNSALALGDGAVVKNDGANELINSNSMAIGTNAGTVASNNAVAIGRGASVTKNSNSAIAFGDGAAATAEAATAVGKGAAAKGADSFAAGTSALSTGGNAVAIGKGAQAGGGNAVAIGNTSTTGGSDSVAVGNQASAAAGKSIAVGSEAGKGMVGDLLGTKGSHVAIGDQAGQNINALQNIAIGFKSGANGSSDYNIAIGSEAGTNIGSPGNAAVGKNVSIGYHANKNDTLKSIIQSTAVGSETKTADDAVALGYQAQATGNGSIAAGFNAQAMDAGSMALGQGASAKGGNIAIGNGSVADPSMISGTGYLTNTAAPATGVSVGTSSALRRITNVADGAQDQDAVTVAQLKKSIDATVAQVNANITSTTATGVFYDTATTGQESITLRNTGNKGTVIHNVANGILGTDAVNVNQLNDTVDSAKTHYYSVKSTNANNYNNDLASGDDSMAAGVSAKALGTRSVSIGNNVESQGTGSIALGSGYDDPNNPGSLTQTLAVTGYEYNTAIGAGAQAAGNHSIAMGTRATSSLKSGGTSVDKAIAIGYSAGVSDDKAIAIGSDAKSNSKSATALGDRAQSLAGNALAIGTAATATGESSGAIGTSNVVSGANTYVIGAKNSAPAAGVTSNGADVTANNSGVFGNENTLNGNGNRVVGNSNIVKQETAKGLSDVMVTGNSNTVSGDADTTTQDDSGDMSGITITGSKNTVKAVNNQKKLADIQIVGNNNKVDTSNKTLDLSNTQILGSNVTATMGNSVYLGSGSAYVADSASTKGMSVYNTDGTYAYAGGTPAGVVTVGSKGKERRIQNVAAGLVSAASTDAVNGSQLYTMTRPLRFAGDNSTIGATAAADVNVLHRGSDQAMSILGGATGALSDGNIGVTADAAANKINVKLAKDLKDLNSVTTGDTVMNTNGVTINNGPSITKNGINAGNKTITNVAAGVNDTDAVNVSQLKKISDVDKGGGFGLADEAGATVKKNLGETVAVVGDNKNTTTKVVGGKLQVALKDDINVNSVTAKTVNTDTVKAGDTTITGNGLVINGGPSITKTGISAGGKTITNVAAGVNDTDAVNVKQLKDTITANKTVLQDGKNTTVTGSGTSADPYKVNLNDHVTLGTDPAKQIDINGETGVIKAGDKVTIDGTKGNITSGKVTVNGENGTVNGLTNKTWDPNNFTSGQAATEDQLKAVDNKITNTTTELTNKGMNFGGNSGASVHKNLGETMEIVGEGAKADDQYSGENIKTYTKDGKLVIGMDKNLKADSIAINGKDGRDGATIKGGDGKPGVDGTNITRLVIEEKDGKQHDIATLDDGMKYGGDTGAVIKKKLNEQVNVVGGITDESKLTTEDNLGVVSDGGSNLKVRMAKDVKGLNTVTTNTLNATTVNATIVNATTVKTGDTTVNDNGLTISNGPSITKAGVDAGNKTITNVAPGAINPTSTDAVNGSQLYQTENKITKLGDRVDRVGAGAAALAALHPLDFDPDDKWDVAAGYGNYKGAHAVAIGAFYRPNEDTMFSVGGSFGGGENMVNAGVSLKLGQGNHVSTSKVAMAKEIIELKDSVARLEAQNEQFRTIIGQMSGQAMKDVTFPDVPKDHWAYEYVKSLADRGLLEGYPDGEFKGDRSMTRYEFAAIIYRALQNGAPVDGNMGKAMDEFGPEIEKVREAYRFRVDRISGTDNDRNKIERIRVNNKNNEEKGDYRDIYGSHIQMENDTH